VTQEEAELGLIRRKTVPVWAALPPTSAVMLGHKPGLWELKDSEHNDIKCHARLKDETVEDDLRRVVKRRSTVEPMHSGQSRTGPKRISATGKQ
ncbi:hypothetical protein BGZ79_006543, partial [Entomortierella chlamydospora]